MTDCDAVIVGIGPGGRDRRRRAHRGGLVGDRAREGPQPPPRARAAVRAARATSATTRSSSSQRHFLGPDPLLEPRTFRRARGRRRPALHRRGEQPPVDGRRRRLPRRRQAAALPRGRLPRSHRELGPIDGADVVDWPLDYDELEPYYAEAERVVGVAGDAHGQPVRGVARRARTRCRRARTCSAPSLTTRSRDPPRLPPVPRADRREQRRVRRPARVQQLRVLRLLRLPDRRQGRSGRAAAARAAHRPVRDPPRVATSPTCCSTRTGRRARGVRYLDADGNDARGDAPATWCSRAARSRRRACCCAAGIGNSRRRRPLPHVPLPDATCSASSRSGCTRTAAGP